MANDALQWALAEVADRRRQTDYKLPRDYYEGRHRLGFEIERFQTVFGSDFLPELRDNLCPAVVDSLADRLRITGFSSSAAERREVAGVRGKRIQVSDPLAAQAWEIWRRNRMKVRATDVHRESLITGDGYAIIWPDPRGKAAIWPQSADEMAILYSEETPGEIDLAARVWRLREGRLRVNLYFRDRTERYVSREQPQPLMGGSLARWVKRKAQSLVAATASVLTGTDLGLLDEIPNPFGRVPVFHFPNRRLYDYGVNELVDVIPLQDALNKSIADMKVAAEFGAYRQRWATGIEVETDDDGKPKGPPFVSGPDRVFSTPASDAAFGDFGETDIRQYLEEQENLRAEVARVSGTPLHYLFITRGDFPSGEAMKSAEARFSRRIEEQHDSKGDSWEEGLEFALTIEDAELPENFELSALWDPPTPRSEQEILEAAKAKRELGVSQTVVLKELGYDDDEIDQMLEENTAAAPPAPSPADPPAPAPSPPPSKNTPPAPS